MMWVLYIHQGSYKRNPWKIKSVSKVVEKLRFITPQRVKYGVTA